MVFTMLVMALALAAADASGKWAGAMKPDDGSRDLSLFMIFRLEDDKLAGSGGPNESEQFPMANGKADGGRLTFEVAAGKGTIHFDLKINGDEASGGIRHVGAEGTRTGQVTLKRVKD